MGVNLQRLALLLPATLPAASQLGAALQGSATQSVAQPGPALKPARGQCGVRYAHTQVALTACAGQLSGQCGCDAGGAESQLALRGLGGGVPRQLALQLCVVRGHLQGVKRQGGGIPQTLGLHLGQAQAGQGVGGLLFGGPVSGLAGLQARIKANTVRRLLRGELAVQHGGGQAGVQRGGVDAKGRRGALPIDSCGLCGLRVGARKLPLRSQTPARACGLQRLNGPMLVHKYHPGVQAVQRQALLVPRAAQSVAQLHLALPAVACRAHAGLAAELGAGCLRPQGRQVQRLPVGVGAGNGLQLPGLELRGDIGQQRLARVGWLGAGWGRGIGSSARHGVRR